MEAAMPKTARTAEPSSARNHQFDLLRIVFATLVLLSHAPELIDGNRSRELFSQLTHTPVSFGEFAVDGFFLLSGFLILQSWQRKPHLVDFVRKRFLRIYPGFIVAALLSTLVVGLCAPGVPHFFGHLNRGFLQSLVVLEVPNTPPAYPADRFYHVVNGALWTVGYEWRCYMVVALLGVIRLLRTRVSWLVLTVLCLVPLFYPELRLYLASYEHLVAYRWRLLFGTLDVTLRLVSIFLVGGCYYLLGRWIPFRPGLAAAASVGLVAAAWLTPQRFEFFLVLLGSYLLFYFGHGRVRGLNWMRHLPDISYGIYLYGWPTEALLIWSGIRNPWVVFVSSTLICFVLGWLSWHLVERPMLRFKRRMAPAMVAV